MMEDDDDELDQASQKSLPPSREHSVDDLTRGYQPSDRDDVRGNQQREDEQEQEIYYSEILESDFKNFTVNLDHIDTKKDVSWDLLMSCGVSYLNSLIRSGIYF